MIQEYNKITETPGTKASLKQLERAYQRYHFALEHAADVDILEVACGTGIGLGYLGRKAKSIVGGDIDDTNLTVAQASYRESKIDLIKLDAELLPFRNESFDLILLFEAIYYLKNASEFITESFRALRKGGKLLICSVNREWKDFHVSPYSERYFSASELHALAGEKFSKVELYGGFPADSEGFLISLIKRFAISLNIIPGSLKARTVLKRIFMGRLIDLPKQLNDDLVQYIPPEQIVSNRRCTEYTIIYALAIKD